MPDKQLYDRAMFWVAAAAVMAAIGGIAFGVAALETVPEHRPVFESQWAIPGAVGVILALVLFWWAIALTLAHGHAG